MNREWDLGLMTDAYGKAFDAEVKTWHDKGLSGPEVIIVARNRGIEAAYDALQLPAPQAPQINMTALLDAIESGDDAYKSSGIHGQGFWRDCVEGAISKAEIFETSQAPQIEGAVDGFDEAMVKMAIRSQIADQFGVVSGQGVEDAYNVMMGTLKALATLKAVQG